MKKNNIAYIAAACILAAAPCISAFAAPNTAGDLQSKGKIVFDHGDSDPSNDIVFDSADLAYLAGKVDTLLAAAE